MIGVILAAGRGTRMGPLTRDTPKPLLGLHGRPILEHIIAGLRDCGIRDLIVVTGYLGDRIESHFGDGARLGVHLSYRVQDRPEGTARALLLARDCFGSDAFVLSWGDIIVEAREYAALLDDFRRKPCDAMLMVNPTDDPWRGAAVFLDERMQVTRLIEKPPRSTAQTRWNNAGVFVFTPLVLDYAERLAPSARDEFELPQAIAAMVADGRVVRAHPIDGFWSDLGTPEDLAAAERTYRPGGNVGGR